MASPIPGVLAGGDHWKILPEEWAKYEAQFIQLNPVQGVVTGDQAKKFFLQSQLPGSVLGQIWAIADTNSDGKMDKNEFAIAMKLVQMKLKGFEVPKLLPQSLKVVAAAVMGGFHQSQMGIGGTQSSIIPSAAFPPTSQFGPASASNGNTFVPQPLPSAGGISMVGASSLISTGPPSPVDAKVQRSSSVTSQDSPTGSVSSPLQEWAIPHQSKLKYTQLFNTNDRMRSGFLTGPQARHILVQTGLPQPVLAQIWALSDINGDGRLSCEEFCVALHLADSVKAGDKLPQALPSDLIPPSFRKRRSSSVTSGGSLPTNGGTSIASQPLSPAPVLLSDIIAQERKAEELKNALMTTFEDKRKENFEKGQAELERRRQALLESQRKEREERERKEREEQERKERIRQEQERRRQIELEKQLAKQREIEQEKEEQRRKAMEQREAARREMERQRQLEWEKQRRQEMLAQRQKEQEKVLQLKAQNQNLSIELEQLNEKTKDLNQRIIDTRGGVADIKNTIDQMRVTRDTKVNELDLLKKRIKEQNLALIQLNHEKAQLDDRIQVNNVNNPTADSFNMVTHSFSSKQITLKNLKDKLSSTESDVAQKMLDIGSNNAQLKELKEKVARMVTDAERLHHTYEEKKKAAVALRGQNKGVAVAVRQQPSDDAFGRAWEKDAWPADATSTAANEWPVDDTSTQQADNWSNEWPKADDEWPTAGQSADVVKYRALYGFDARNPDELAIMPGDIVTVFLDQSTEPGWLSGELKGKTGWFPEAYVERMDATENGGMQENEAGGSLTGVQETVHIVGTEMKMTLSGIQEAPESISDNGSIGGEMAASEGPLPSAFIQVPKSGAPGTASPVQGQGQFVEGLQAQALFPWRAKKENHLTFNKSDVITIREQQDIWWFGELEDRQGWFPKSYVRLISGLKRLTDQGSRSQTPMSDTSSQAELTNVPDLTGGSVTVDAEQDYYIATYPYQSAEQGDLTFNRGDIIEVTRMDGDWWSGTIGERSGIFPCNYVKKVDDIQEGDVDLPEEPPPEPDVEAPTGLLTQGRAPCLEAKTKGGKKPDIATVIAPYTATGPEQLNLQRGQLLSVRKKNESGWWEGELHAKGKKRQVGWFPASYVKLLSMSSGDLSARSTPEPILNKEDGGSPPTMKAPQEKVVALYPYDAQNEDELTFSKGAVISVVSREDAAWWKGEYGGMVGVFPSNYVQAWDGASAEENVSSDTLANLPPVERKRQEHIRELLATEETYMEDMSIVLDAFCKPLKEAKIMSELELDTIFVNWNELINCNTKLLKAMRVRRKMSPNGIIQMIGDILCENFPSLSPYIRFCSCQLNAAAIIQNKTENSQEFRDITKKCCMDPRTKGMPISSFLLKPMQRITRYPLLIKKILEHTGESHPDHANLTDALSRSEELCMQVNEGVREKENSDRLEFVQRTVNCDGVIEKITFNSLTNSLGPRKFLHSGSLIKIKSGKELTAFLFNDFLLLTQPYKNYGSVSSLFNLEKIANTQFKMYKKPMFLHGLEIKKLSESGEDTTNFVFVHDGHSFAFKAPTVNERNTWIRKLQSAAAHYRDVESKKNVRNMSLQKQQRPALGRLLVVVLEAVDLRAKANVRRGPPVGALRVIIVEATNLMCFKIKGRSDPYCEVNMGSQEQRTKVINDTLNPKWNASMQFHVKDPKEDVLCVTVFDRDYFSPNDFLGRTEIRIAEIIRETHKTMGPVIMKKPLHEVDTGEIVVKLDIQLFT